MRKLRLSKLDTQEQPLMNGRKSLLMMGKMVVGIQLILLMDAHGEIRYDKVFQWCLVRYGANDDQISFEFQAARMQIFMKKRIIEDGFKPRYYIGNKLITGDHAARLYGACLCRMNHGGRSLNRYFQQEK